MFVTAAADYVSANTLDEKAQSRFSLQTVHPLQVVDRDRLPMQGHDWPLDWIVTPTGAIATQTAYPRPQGLDWEALQPDQLQQMPVLQQLAQQRRQGKITLD